MKLTLRLNEYLNIEILEYFYVQKLNIKQIYRKIKKKICIDNIRKIISEHKLYIEYKHYNSEIKPTPE